MIPQNQNNGRSRGRSNAGRPAPGRNYSRIPIVSDVIDMFSGGGGQPEMQTTTQQNLPSWAVPDAMSTLSMGNYYTQNPDYRASTLDRDYSGLRGYDSMGRPNSQVGQFGLNPMDYTRPLLADPSNFNNMTSRLPSNFQGGLDSRGSGSQPSVGIADRVGANVLENDAQRQEMLRQREGSGTMQSPPGFRGRPGTGLKFADEMSISGRGTGRYAAPTTGPAATPGGDFNNTAPGGASSGQTSSENQTFNLWDYYDELSGKNKNKNTDNYYSSDTYDGSFADTTSGDSGYDEYDSGYDITSPPAVDGGLEFSNEDSWVWGSGNNGNSSNNTSSETQGSNTNTQTDTTTTTDPTIDPADIFNPDDLTPFQAYDRQRFAAPSQNTVRGEGILAGRYDQRFGEGGTDPFAAANQAVGRAANYQSGFQGTTGGIGGQAGNYQTNLANASNPGVFQSGDYTSSLPNYANPNAGMQSTQFGNANAGLTGPKNYDKNFQNLVNQSMNPYQDQVVNQTISDLDRARRMTQNQIGGQAAKAGAFGGSRQALLEAENNRNYLDRVAAATGQLRQQGFESAANRASQENLKRLGLTAQDLQQTRGLQSQGNLAAQNLTAQDAQNVRGLQSQGNLAALNANAGLFQNALGLNAAGDRSAMGYNAGLLSDAMGLDAADLNQRRNIASNESQFAETANRGAGALNLQGGTALGQLAQAGTADERQRIADMLASGQAGDARNQQDLDFIYNEFNRELQYPGQQIDLRNAAISPATGSIVTTTQPRYQQNPLLAGLGAGVGTYALAGNPYLAGAAGLLSYLNS